MSDPRPHDLAFTLFGEYLLHRESPVATGSLIELFGPLGLSAAATRTVLSRMTRRGWLEAFRSGRRSFYAPTARGRKLLVEGARRIHHPPRGAGWDGLWYLVAYSIPETRRPLRDRLRARLEWLGFGQLGNGLWISPHQVRGEVNEVAGELGIADHLEIFRAQYQGYSSAAHLVAQAWDLATVDARYAAFVERHRPAYERCLHDPAAGGADPRECFVRRFFLVHEYREFPRIDPYLPDRLLPAGWRGGEAAELFRDYHALLRAPADAFVESVAGPGSATASRRAREA
jgi:phenylacetic acid degradation operon negative regulatory protein